MKAMRDLDPYFETLRPTQTENFAVGADLFKSMLYQIERVDTPLDELERIGRADLERNVATLEVECASYAEKFFHDEAYQDPPTSKQQAARGTFDPEYLDYTLGKLMIRKLRADWEATRGGKGSWKDFHDKFLAYGGPPIPMIRKAMVGDAGSLF